ncbi:MAG: ribonuclease HII [Deltaproteobacteria bacterium]|nr:ribonuclease HII [Deltaproteobacteria bacterium]
MLKPSLLELDLLKMNSNIIGVDEVGRGCLAGPVVSAAISFHDWSEIKGIQDSKKVSKKKREALIPLIQSKAHVGIGVIEPQEIDCINILQASLLSMKKAILNLISSSVIASATKQRNRDSDEITTVARLPRDYTLQGGKITPYILIDGHLTLDIEFPQKPIIGGDGSCYSIAAASIIAKVYRDRLMESYAKTYPGYDFENNVGYGTQKHRDAIEVNGVTPIHRKTFRGVREFV